MDKYRIYRPLLDLIGRTEGTDKGRGYNETLAYGALTGGPVDLVTMTLAEIDRLQTRMLQQPNNRWNSSALGRYQIIRTTLRTIKARLNLPDTALYDAAMQDRLACFLLGVRGIDRYIDGRLGEDAMINELAKEWASLPTTAGRGHYGGQNAAATVAEVRKALKDVKARAGKAPAEIVVVEQPVVRDPEDLDKPMAKSKTVWQWLLTAIGAPAAAFAGLDWRAQLAIVVIITAFAAYAIKRRWDLARVMRALKAEVAGDA